ncbi:hypothetical protein TNCT_712401 [Trichonephila clavata]|uniref:Uncharacterized protein n=1 Tax=Trichonephila clavata TaxID=2740835 RepID=A0A8X6H8X1_TRICU|nr:hypothetical protein TNCT_712401 [Trichonephila clavata]
MVRLLVVIQPSAVSCTLSSAFSTFCPSIVQESSDLGLLASVSQLRVTVPPRGASDGPRIHNLFERSMDEKCIR